ncbi:MAG TPA: Txe/YoeB family addiction module toxin [Rhodanobacteraceae bacterium]|nr:Txe/YoeB family addiction module toxin [Rhodanobacteraceae bacterium]
MARRVAFTPQAWDNYLYWQLQDRKIVLRINELIRECQRDPFSGIGKPEALKRDLAGCWSRRIDQTHRLVYRVGSEKIEILSCRHHYGDH